MRKTVYCDSKPTILLLTNKFPFGVGETFLEAEMESIPDDINLIVLPTQPQTLGNHSRTIKESIKVDSFLCGRSRIEYYLCSICMLFSDLFHREVKRRKENCELTIKLYIKILGYYSRAKLISRAMMQKYGNLLKNDRTILYSYWLTEASLAELMIKRELGTISVSRAHGVDVYDGRCVYKTIPGQIDVIQEIDKVYVCSKNGRDYLQKKYPKYKNNITHSYLGSIDYGYIFEDNRTDVFTVVSCSRLVPGKRVQLISKALSYIKDRNIRWVHIGDGIEKTRILEDIKQLPRNISCELLGDIDHDDVMKFYLDNQVNLFISASESEGLPVSIMEATSFGIPIIATDVGGTNEVLSRNVCDLIPSDFDTRELADRIYKYIDMDTATYCNIRKEIRTYWLNNFNALDNYKKFYENLLKK